MTMFLFMVGSIPTISFPAMVFSSHDRTITGFYVKFTNTISCLKRSTGYTYLIIVKWYFFKIALVIQRIACVQLIQHIAHCT